MAKRRHKRFSITGLTTLQFEDHGQMKTSQGILGSISYVGMGLYVDNPIEANKRVSVAMNFISIGGGIKDSVIDGRVICSREIGKIFLVGIEFHEAVNSRNQPLLYKHIQNIYTLNK
jgi:hypothetical protein